ncbi:MAG: hypothetical protein ACRDRV_09730 [Pseudonocardiaceae bacterium]
MVRASHLIELVTNLLRQADKIKNHGKRMQELADEPKQGPAARRAAAIWAANAAAAGEARTRAEAQRLQAPMGPIPEKVRLAIAHNPGEYIRDGKGDLQENRRVWELVHEGIVQSVTAGGAKTNGLLHRAFGVPRPGSGSSR